MKWARHGRLEPAAQGRISVDAMHLRQQITVQERVACQVDAVPRAEQHVVDDVPAAVVEGDRDAVAGRLHRGHELPAVDRHLAVDAWLEPAGAGRTDGAPIEGVPAAGRHPVHQTRHPDQLTEQRRPTSGGAYSRWTPDRARAATDAGSATARPGPGDDIHRRHARAATRPTPARSAHNRRRAPAVRRSSRGRCAAMRETSSSAGRGRRAARAMAGDAGGDDDLLRGDPFTVGQGEHEAAHGSLHPLDPATIHLGHRLGLEPSPVLDKRFQRHRRTDGHAGGAEKPSRSSSAGSLMLLAIRGGAACMPVAAFPAQRTLVRRRPARPRRSLSDEPSRQDRTDRRQLSKLWARTRLPANCHR